MRYKLIPYQLQFKQTFKIAHTSREYTDNCYLVVRKGGSTGVGEAVYPPYVNEDRTSLIALSKQLDSLTDFKKEGIKSFLAVSFEKFKDAPASFCALDTALIDWWCNKNGKSIIDFFSVDLEPVNWETSFTIGISTYHDFIEKIKSASQFKMIKLKVNESLAHETVKAYSKHSVRPFMVDANQGFGGVENALKFASYLQEAGCLYLEQPFIKSENEKVTELKKSVNIPIIADESFQRYDDLEHIVKYYDGVNLKLMKCGGLSQGYKIILRAKELGLKVVLGCMSGSRVAIDHAEAFAPYVDWVDLDGKYLIKNNPSNEFLLN